MNSKEAIARLTECGVKPSVQRIAIMHYLLTHYTHPTVDDVYRGLCGKMPTLSRTTVYNTLRLLSENNAAQMITIDEHRVCYDGNVNAHAHFYCKKCKRVFDVFMDDYEKIQNIFANNVQGKVESCAVSLTGSCKECSENN